jgi:disease resistance protein RPM1
LIVGADWVGKLMSLEELDVLLYVHVHDRDVRQFVKELGRLRELRVFRMVLGGYDDRMDESMQTDLVESLCNLQKIQHLRFIFRMDVDTAKWEAAGFVLSPHLRVLSMPNIKFSTLPSCINPSRLPNITTLYLNVDAMDEQDLESLGRLPELLDLSLTIYSTVTISNIAGNGYFQKLRCLDMFNSMLKFLPSKEDSSVSLHISNGRDDIPFGYEKTDERRAAPTVMPSLEKISSTIFVWAFKDGSYGCDTLGLEHPPSLHTAQFFMQYDEYDGKSDAEVDEAEAALRNAIQAVHPKTPTLEIIGRSRYKNRNQMFK